MMNRLAAVEDRESFFADLGAGSGQSWLLHPLCVAFVAFAIKFAPETLPHQPSLADRKLMCAFLDNDQLVDAVAELWW